MDSQFKRTPIPKLKGDQVSAVRQVSCPAPLMKAPWRQALRGPDQVIAAHRVLVNQHTGGSPAWFINNDDPNSIAQEFPVADVWRTVKRAKVCLSPGCVLQVRVLATRSGPVQWFGTIDAVTQWHHKGNAGRIRVNVSYTNDLAETDTRTVEVFLPGSDLEDGAESTDAGASWFVLLHRSVLLVHPLAALQSPLEAAKWSEWPELEIEIQHEGGARVIQVVVQETPWDHVAAHDREDITIHSWPEVQGVPDQRPQVEQADGATYEEHRFGAKRALIAARRLTERAGPVLATWSSYNEADATPTMLEAAAASASSTTPVGLSIGASVTAWDPDAPGHSISGHYAGRAPENLITRLDGARAIPARFWVYARFTTNADVETGTIRFQTSPRTWIDVEVRELSAWTWYQAIGWIEASATAGDFEVWLQDFFFATGGTVQARYWALETGEFNPA
jgi:hypothetical protein